MRSILLALFSLAAGVPAWAQTVSWDTSGNNKLNGTYYFRQTIYFLSNAANGSLADAASLYGTVSFDGAGKYTMSATLVDLASQQLQSGPLNGTYSIAASGYGFLSSPLFTGDYVYGLVNAQGIFVGSSTDNATGDNDLFIAAPLSATPPTASTFKGSYTLAYMNPSSGSPLSTYDALATMSPDGAGNIGTVAATGYAGQSGSSKITQSLSSVKYLFTNGAGVITFPANNSAILSGQYYVYISPDGNFVFGGAPYSADMFVGVRTGSASPNLTGLYYQAGMDLDTSTLSSGYATLDTYFGSLNAPGTAALGHQRLLSLFNASAVDYSYSEPYTVKSDGTYSTPSMSYVVGSGIRVGYGLGPYLGINVALQAPAISSTLSPSNVFLNPTGIVNAGSFAPFTASIVPGELLVLYGSGLAPDFQIASGAPFPNNLDGVQVTINSQPAPLYYVSATQISAIVPYGITGGLAQITVNNNGALSNTVVQYIGATAPGVLTQSQNGLGYGDILRPDYSKMTAQNPTKIGETIAVYLTGLGAVSPAISDGAAGPISTFSQTTNPITAYIGGISAPVGYAGLAPGYAGLYQVNVTVPAGVTAGDNTLDISGPDSYNSQCLITVVATSTSSAVTSPFPQARGLALTHGRGLRESRRKF
jgi:uncharacterized protein (TIGR03437 family)